MLEEAFFGLLNRHFTSLPGNTVFDLVSEDTGSHYLSDMTFQDVPVAFTWGGTEQVAKAVQISPGAAARRVSRRGASRYYEDEILEGTADTADGALETEPFAEVVLLEDVRMFEWRVLDGRTLEWEWDWDIRGRMPLQVELTIAFGAQGDKIRQVFWIPPKQNPEVLMRQMQQGGRTDGRTPDQLAKVETRRRGRRGRRAAGNPSRWWWRPRRSGSAGRRTSGRRWGGRPRRRGRPAGRRSRQEDQADEVPSNTRRLGRRRGSALVAVLWLIAILALTALATVQVVTLDVDVVSAQVTGFRARQLAEAGHRGRCQPGGRAR